MADRGMGMVRINCSHGNQEQYQEIIDTVREVNNQYGKDIKILQDLEGYRIRIGFLKEEILLKKNEIFYMVSVETSSKDEIPFDYKEEMDLIPIGSIVFIEDGKMSLKVLSNTNNRLKVRVIQGGILKSRKGVNIQGLKLTRSVFTDKDKIDLEFGLKK